MAAPYRQPTGAEVSSGMDAPASGAFLVTKSDTTVISARGLYVGTGGDVYVDTLAGEIDTPFFSVPGGSIIPVRCIRVKAATTASNITAMY